MSKINTVLISILCIGQILCLRISIDTRKQTDQIRLEQFFLHHQTQKEINSLRSIDPPLNLHDIYKTINY